jgi:N-acetylneuraminic acid mutarotase
LEDRQLLSVAMAGEDNDLLYDAANHTTWVAYFDPTSQSLKVRSRVDGGNWSAETEVDSVPGSQIGKYPSIAEAGNGTIGVAYYDGSAADLKYVERDPSTGVWGTPQGVDTGTGRSGAYPSLAYNTKNNPFISYWTDVTNSTDILRLSYRSGGVWTVPTPVDQGADVGRYSSMVFTSTGWNVSYVTPNGCRFAYQSGSSIVKEDIDTSGAAAYTSLAMDGNSKPWVAYYRSSDTRVLVAHKTTSWQTPQSVFGNKGYNVNLWFEPGGTDARLVFKDGATPLNQSAHNNVRKFNYTSGAWQSDTDPSTIMFDGVSDQVSAVRGANGAITFTGVASMQTSATPTYSKYLQIRDEADAGIGQNWPKVTQSTTSPAPTGANPGVEFNGSLWIVGKAGAGVTRDDVWNSTDNGVTWTNVTAGLSNGAAFGMRYQHQLTVFNGELWVTGGYDGSTYFSDAWHSSDGVNWTLASTGGYVERAEHSAVVNNGRLYLIAGFNHNNQLLNDVWSTADGVTWQQDTASAPFTRRSYVSTVSYNGRIFVIGGYTGGMAPVSNQVFSSADGANWIQVNGGNSTAPAREGGTTLVFDNRMWYLGGRDSTMTQKDNVYYSIDGLNWAQAGTLPEGRSEAAGMVLNDRMWLIGGNVAGQTSNQDVLSSNP